MLIAQAVKQLALLGKEDRAQFVDEGHPLFADREKAYAAVSRILAPLDQPPVDQPLNDAGGHVRLDAERFGHAADGRLPLSEDECEHHDLLKGEIVVEQRRGLRGQPRGEQPDLDSPDLVE